MEDPTTPVSSFLSLLSMEYLYDPKMVYTRPHFQEVLHDKLSVCGGDYILSPSWDWPLAKYNHQSSNGSSVEECTKSALILRITMWHVWVLISLCEATHHTHTLKRHFYVAFKTFLNFFFTKKKVLVMSMFCCRQFLIKRYIFF